MDLTGIEGCNFGREVSDWQRLDRSLDLRAALHDHGMLLFRDVRDLTSNQLADLVSRWFPRMAIDPPSANRPADGGPMTVLGSTRDAEGRFNADYVPAATVGAPLLSADGQWDDALEASLLEWIRHKRECAFMEWHTDATFRPWPTTYAALYCRRPGASATGFASATAGLERLNGELRDLAEKAVCTYRPSIIYGNAELGIPAISSRSVQLTAMRRGPHDMAPEVGGSLERPPHADDPVVRHALVQTHPHTGQRSLRFSLKSLETLIPDWSQPDRDLPMELGKRAAWQIMRQATAGEGAYLHQWREGDFIIWDERNSMHCRVPYDAECQVREMWRMVFEIDPADYAYNERCPQLNLTRG